VNDGIISYHEKLVLKIFQDESKGIEIQGIPPILIAFNSSLFQYRNG